MVRNSNLHPTDQSLKTTIKFLCSYGGKIAPRYPDGKLRYHGGHTRVLSVDSFISFSELLLKMTELCGSSVTVRCQLPNEDLDALVTIKSDEDLANLIEEYDRFSTSTMKIRVFLSPIRTSKAPSPQSSEYAASSPSPKSLSPSSSISSVGYSPRFVPLYYKKQSETGACHHCYRNPSHIYLIHNGNHWQ